MVDADGGACGRLEVRIGHEAAEEEAEELVGCEHALAHTARVQAVGEHEGGGQQGA